MDCNSPIVHLITGYRGTGKDQLHVNLTAGIKPLGYEVYAVNRNHCEILMIPSRTRVGLADALKLEVHQQLRDNGVNLPPHADKTMLVNDRTLRELYIEHGTLQRRQNPDHWVTMAADQIAGLNCSGCIDITDWRYLNELTYLRERFPVVTTRIYRSDVPIPPADVESEHNLDLVLTDVILVPSNDVDDCLQLFPYYADYYHVMNL
jgi:hypothetical protein